MAPPRPVIGVNVVNRAAPVTQVTTVNTGGVNKTITNVTGPGGVNKTITNV